MKKATLLLAASLSIVGALPDVASADDGQLEINAACVQTGCFPGDAPGYPVRISQSGAYRLTSNLVQSVIPGLSSATTAIEIFADGVDLDLAGFTIGCSNPLGGSCGGGNADGVFSIGSARREIHVANGRIKGMPRDGLALDSGSGAVVENVRAIDNGERGIAAGVDSRITGCTAVGNGFQGIFANGHSVLTHNVSNENGGAGISTGSAVIAENTVSGNGSDGISTTSSVIRDNQVSNNAGVGIRATWQSKVEDNVVVGNGGVGLLVTNGTYQGNLINGNAGGTVSGGINFGSNSCNLAATCP